MSLRTPILRLVLAAILPFLMAANALAMPVTTASMEQAVSIPMTDMSGCDEGADPRIAAKCSIDCPLICGAIAANGPSIDERLARTAPPVSPSVSNVQTGISISPDYPPPR